jgi:hypothetical protein
MSHLNPHLFHELWAFSAGIWVVIFWPHFHGWRDKLAVVMFAWCLGPVFSAIWIVCALADWWAAQREERLP